MFESSLCGVRYSSDRFTGNDGGFGCGGGSGVFEGGGGGGYIGALVNNVDYNNDDNSKYQYYGALSYNKAKNNQYKINISGFHKGNGKVEIKFIE